MELIVDGRVLETRDKGFLVHREDWSEALAAVIADQEGIVLTPAHWEIVRFMQRYYDETRHLPNTRQFTKAVQKALGPDKGNSRYLFGLFPNGPLRLACKIGGLPKPPTCIV